MESLYKVGDVVKIKQLSADEDGDYRFGVNSDMAKKSGKSFEIVDVSPTIAFEGRFSDDGFKYMLKGNSWAWASSMFEEPKGKGKKSTKSKTGKSKIKISFSKKRKLKFNFSL